MFWNSSKKGWSFDHPLKKIIHNENQLLDYNKYVLGCKVEAKRGFSRVIMNIVLLLYSDASDY
jgi:hypothetical protein